MSNQAASNHLGDPRLNLCDLYVFGSPADPQRTALILTANPEAGPLYPGAVYRLAIDHSGDLRNDIAFSFVYSEPVGGAQTVDVYLAVGNQAATVAAVGSQIFGGVEVSFGQGSTIVESGGFTFAAGARSDPSHAESDVIAMAIELPDSYLSASPDVRIWGRCSVMKDREWVHADRAGHPSLGSFITGDVVRAQYRASEPNRDRERWMGPLIDGMVGTGAYNRGEAIAAIEADGMLPDVLTYNPSRPTKYPNGRALTDDPDVVAEFPYLGPPRLGLPRLGLPRLGLPRR